MSAEALLSGKRPDAAMKNEKPERHLRLVPDLPTKTQQTIEPLNLPLRSPKSRDVAMVAAQKNPQNFSTRTMDFPGAEQFSKPLTIPLKEQTVKENLINVGEKASTFFTQQMTENPQATQITTEPAMTPLGTCGELFVDIDPKGKFQSIKMHDIVPGEKPADDKLTYYRLHLDSNMVSKRTDYGIEVGVANKQEKYEISRKIDAIVKAAEKTVFERTKASK